MAIREMHQEHLEARALSRNIQEKNADAFTDITRVLQQQVSALDGLQDLVRDVLNHRRHHQ